MILNESTLFAQLFESHQGRIPIAKKIMGFEGVTLIPLEHRRTVSGLQQLIFVFFSFAS